MKHRPRPSAHPIVRARLLLAGLALASIAATGCWNEAGVVTFGRYEFSDGFKPSLSRVDRSEIDALEFASDGGPGGNQIVSEVDWSTLAAGSASVYGKLRRSECLWASRRGRPRLSWDTILSDALAEDWDGNVLDVSFDEISLAGDRPRDAYTRDILHINGEAVTGIYLPIMTGISVRLSRFDAGPDNEYGLCQLNDRGLVVADEFYAPGVVVGCEVRKAQANQYPYTVVGCERQTPAGDAGWQVEAVDLDLGTTAVTVEGITVRDQTVSGEPRRLLPDIKQVQTLRTIARPLAFAGVEIQNSPGGCDKIAPGIPCSEFEAPEVDGIRRASEAFWHWDWQTPSIDADGTGNPDGLWWRENFSPNVFVSEAAVFREGNFDPDAAQHDRIYLAPERLKLTPRRSNGDLVCTGIPGMRGSGCEAEQDGTGVRFRVDEQGHLVTPTYRLDDMQSSDPARIPQKLEWRVEFAVPILDGEPFEPPSVVPGEPLFLELVLNDALANGSVSGSMNVTISPAFRDYGDVHLAVENHFPRAFRVANNGFTSVVVDAVRLVAGAGFQLALEAGAATPFSLMPGEALDLDLTYKATEYGLQEAVVEVDLRSGPGSLPLQVRARLHAVDAIPNVLPQELVLLSPPRPGAYLQPALHALIENTGHWPLEVTDITLEGADAASFRFEGNGGSGPVALPFTLQPGDAEQVLVRYLPVAQPTAADHEAVLRFGTSGGARSVPLHGRWRP